MLGQEVPPYSLHSPCGQGHHFRNLKCLSVPLKKTLDRCSFPDYGAFCVAWPLSSVFLAWLILCWGSVGLVFRKQPRSSTPLVGHGTICTEWEPPITCEWGRFHPLRLPHSFPHTMEKGAWKQAPARHSEWGSLALARAPRNPQACAM
jgi:hypothetical protein